MAMKFKRRSADKSRKRKVLLVILLILIVIFISDRQLRPVITNGAKIQAQAAVNLMVNRAIGEVMQNLNTDYNSLVNLAYNQNGEIVAITSDAIGINILKAEITKSIQQNMNELDRERVQIAVGSLTRSDFFVGRGRDVDLIIQLSGAVGTEVVGSFDAAGINQTRHRLMLNVQTNIQVAIPWHTDIIAFNTNFLLAETVLVGKVPNAYTNIARAEFIDEFDVANFGAGG